MRLGAKLTAEGDVQEAAMGRADFGKGEEPLCLPLGEGRIFGYYELLLLLLFSSLHDLTIVSHLNL
jgi:hypothetical protein